jgi:hypothetical protein
MALGVSVRVRPGKDELMARKPRKPAPKKPARRAAKKKPTASAAPVRQPILVRVGSSQPDVMAMDAGLGLLTTVEIALSSWEAFSDNDEAMALRVTIEQAMKLLRPVREAINELPA